jgi:hypothetical protein
LFAHGTCPDLEWNRILNTHLPVLLRDGIESIEVTSRGFWLVLKLDGYGIEIPFDGAGENNLQWFPLLSP